MAMNKNNKWAVILAALLHDIGKFNWSTKDYSLSESNRITKSIFDNFIAVRTCILPIKDEVSKLLQNSDNLILNVINDADNLDLEESKIVSTDRQKSPFLSSVFSKISLTKEIPQGNYLYRPHKLTIEDIFPEKFDGNVLIEKVISQNEELFKEFIEELKIIPEGTIEAYIDNLLFLYEKYISYSPSGVYGNQTDISLYDHSRTVSALASCYDECDNNENPFLIIGADISGIQNFIYNEHSPIENSTKGLSKRLRGKSFYLILLTDTFADYLLKLLGLSKANLLINGGGHFILVAPNNNDNLNKIETARNNIQKWFYETFKGELNLIIEYLIADDTLYKNYPEWHNQISNKLLKGKRQKSIDIIKDVFKINLDNVDLSRHSLKPREEDITLYKDFNDYQKNLYLFERLYEEIGMKLPRSNFLIEICTEEKEHIDYQRQHQTLIPFDDFNMYWLFINDYDDLKYFLNNNKSSKINFLRILRLNESSVSPDRSKCESINQMASNCTFGVSIGFKFIGRSTVFDEGGNVMEFSSFSLLNTEDSKKLDYPLLAILRMDVDNLGAIFSFGLERELKAEGIRTLSRTVNLSRDVNLFFVGYLNKLAEKRQIYITYSGGDDLFVVGSWINIINFAFEVSNDFKKYACNNPNVTISAGIYLCKPNYPIGKAANGAGENEEKAKSRYVDKDCISIFGKEYKWDELKEFLDYARSLDKLIDSNQVTPGYIHYLLDQTFDLENEDGEINLDIYFSKISKIKYSLARNPRKVNEEKIQKVKNGNKFENKDEEQKITLLSKLIVDIDSKKYLKNFIVPASYIVFKNRKSKN